MQMVCHRRLGWVARLALLPALLGLGACQQLADGATAAGLPIQTWNHVVQQRQPQPVITQFQHAVAFTPGDLTLAPAEVAQLRGFLAELQVTASDQVYLTGAGSQSPSGRAERDTVGRVLTGAGIRWQPMAPGTVASPPPSHVTVVVQRLVVQLPACPDWSSMPNSNFQNQPNSNWSCATAVNLGLMVANPADLAAGRSPGSADGTVMARSIERYRLGKTKPLIRDAGSSDVYPSSGSSGSD